jgi:hypothetical protein
MVYQKVAHLIGLFVFFKNNELSKVAQLAKVGQSCHPVKNFLSYLFVLKTL